jgi:hypothetical protein
MRDYARTDIIKMRDLHKKCANRAIARPRCNTGHPWVSLPGTSFVNVTPNPLSGDISGTSLLNATELQSPLSLLADVAFNLSNTISIPHIVSTCNVNSDSSDLSSCSNVNSTSSDVSSNVNSASSVSVSTCITYTNTTPITPVWFRSSWYSFIICYESTSIPIMQ